MDSANNLKWTIKAYIRWLIDKEAPYKLERKELCPNCGADLRVWEEILQERHFCPPQKPAIAQERKKEEHRCYERNEEGTE